MKQMRGLLMGSLLLAAGWSASGQVTNVVVETNGSRLVWTAMPGNPYRVYATPDMEEPIVWTNVTPGGLVFTNQQGFYDLSTGSFYCAMASDYLIVDLSGGPTATNYPVSYTNSPPAGGWGDAYKTTNLVLRRIPGGCFPMGSPTNELGHDSNEPPHVVKLTKDYYVGVFEVTQKQWERVRGTWPSDFSNAAYRESRPVEHVSYNDIRGTVAGTNWPADGNVDTNSFLGRLRTKTGQTFDLPTAAQWERACRSGTTNALNSGFDLTNTVADVHMDAVGRYWDNGGSTYTYTGSMAVGTAKVGSYVPSPWGLYDAHGNVCEWCLDWYDSAPAGALDPPGPVSGIRRVLRGGSWAESAEDCRSANDRGTGLPPSDSGRQDYSGFRLFLPLGQ
jgi:formylglycine-generating enzyme required for sulfatase activity